VHELGAARVIDYRAQPVTELDTRFDLVFDCAAALSFWSARKILAPSGSYVTTLPSPSAISGLAFGWLVGRRCKLVIVKSRARDLAQLAAWLETGAVRAHVERTVPWTVAGVRGGLELLASGAVRGKIGVAGPAGAAAAA
jgi:NADPH:quinone reductase-like Zn-dependent oxidoreductase